MREGLRSRSALACGLVFAVLALGAWFAGELALTESARIRAGFFAATARIAAVLLLCLHVVNALQREWADGEAALILALAIGRSTWLAGRMAGFVLLALLFALLAGLFALAFAPWRHALVWATSLAPEFALMAGFAGFAALGLRSPVSALALISGFYLLARNIAAIQLIASNPLGGAPAWPDTLAHSIGLLLPDLSQLTSAAVLADGAAILPGQAWIQAAIYLLLCFAAASFELTRREA